MPLSKFILRFRPVARLTFLFRKDAVKRAGCALAGALLIAALFVAAIAPQRYDLRVGMVATMDIMATKDVVDTVATDDKRDQAAAAVLPVYYVDESITDSVLSSIELIFTDLRTVLKYAQTLHESDPALSAFTAEQIKYASEMLTSVKLTSYQIEALLYVDPIVLEQLYERLHSTVRYEMDANRVTVGQEKLSIQRVLDMIGYVTDPVLLQYIARPVLSTAIHANRLVDEEATALKRQEARDAVENVMVLQGEPIVQKGGGRITRRQITLLQSLGILSDGTIDITMYIGGVLTVFITLGITLLALAFVPDSPLHDMKRMIVLMLIIFVSLGLCIATRLLSNYLMPMAMAAILGSVLLGIPSGIAAGVAVTVLASALMAGGAEIYSTSMVHLLVIGLFSGTLAALSLRQRPTRVRVLLSGLIAALAGPAALTSISFMTSSTMDSLLPTVYYVAVSGLLSAVLCVGAQPLLESLFNLPTAARLLELSNPNQPLLRRMLLEAPGTYHHSLIVGNLSEAAADAVGANALLARVAGTFHDVGKLKRPLYFMENQMGVNPHDHTDPYVSAAIVTAHVPDGVSLGRNYRLPQAVLDIVFEHHGDTATMYFYHKALQQADGKPVDISRFRYAGRRPTTRESAIVMLADTIEAAVRSMNDPTPARIEDFIIRLVRGKLEDGQLGNSPLTLHDIDAICLAFATVLIGVFHERIEYPQVEHPPRLLEQMKAEAEKKQQDELAALAGAEAAISHEMDAMRASHASAANQTIDTPDAASAQDANLPTETPAPSEDTPQDAPAPNEPTTTTPEAQP